MIQVPENGSRHETAVRLFAVIVIYRRQPGESTTFRTLLDAAQDIHRAGLKLGILIWDNTPGGQDIQDLPAGIRYKAAPTNPGLACAYNHALEIAGDEGYDWLLTLDQDTVLPLNFLTRIAELTRELLSSARVGAIVPQITGDGRNLSPYRHAMGAIPRWFRYGFVGIPETTVYALNSAATLRVTALKQIGGYDPTFPLDASDLNLFHRLHQSGKRVFVAGDLLISHDFSLLKKHRRMSIGRYQSLLLYECAFWDIYLGPLARLERMIRLAGRACKELLSPEEREFRKLTVAELKRRLVTPRKRRIEEWKKWAHSRSAVSGDVPDPQSALQR